MSTVIFIRKTIYKRLHLCRGSLFLSVFSSKDQNVLTPGRDLTLFVEVLSKVEHPGIESKTFGRDMKEETWWYLLLGI